MTKIVEVAASVMLRDEGREFLLAQRPEGKVYAGYWEFPGGKVEPGESVREALIRELQEELGITVTQCAPWLIRQFTYPHATVRLNFWRVTAWSGAIGITAPLEHTAVNWQRCTENSTVSPILPANDPILKALALPTRMAITSGEASDADDQLKRLEVALQNGLRLIQVRNNHWPAEALLRFAKAVCQLAHQHGAVVMINGNEALALASGADGLHLPANHLADCAKRPDFKWVGASCHSADEIKRAGELDLDYALLSPVLLTPSHPEAKGLGWLRFSEEISATTIPVFALGGMKPEFLAEAQSHGAQGIALMSAW